jgi:hypothetical protein
MRFARLCRRADGEGRTICTVLSCCQHMRLEGRRGCQADKRRVHGYAVAEKAVKSTYTCRGSTVGHEAITVR